jgi:uncharacterized protein (DUF2141 family)
MFLLMTDPARSDSSSGALMGHLTIVVPSLASNDGSVRIYVHEPHTFARENLSKREGGTCLTHAVSEISGNQATWTTDAIPFGKYAVIVHHDFNDDGKVNFGSVLPTEPVGYSNYDRAIASYPEFHRACVVLAAPKQEVRVEAFMQGRLFRKQLKQ